MLAIELEHQHIAQTYARPPFVLTHGQGMNLWDSTGKAYLDFVAGIAVMSLGHSDPQITRIIQEQATQLVQTSNLYYTQPQADLAAALCQASFADRVYFGNSGAEAIEASLKFARKFAKQHHPAKTEIIAFEGAFHGRTYGAVSITPKAKYQDPFRPLLPNISILPFNDSAAARAAIGPQTCAVVVEPIQGEGGINPAIPEFLQTLREACNAHNALLIFDEIQCGLGRTGELWAHTACGVTPDMMTLAKPLASGLPIGAVLMSERVHSVLSPGDHGSTFAGGALVCAVAAHVVERIQSPDLLAHVQMMGMYLRDGLSTITSPHILDIRGTGLMQGIELDVAAADVVTAGYAAGLLLVNAGPNVVRFVPPLIVEQSHIDHLLNFLSDYLINA